MAKLPSYVRLPDELYLGIVADLESGWHISGLQVKAAPTDPQDPAYKYVQTALRQGKLEPASEEEFSFQEQHHAMLSDLAGPTRAGEAEGTWNEPVIAAAVREGRREMVRLRNADRARRSGTEEDEDLGESEYASWTNTRLKEELKDRGLETHGSKSELITRLDESDKTPVA